MLNDRLRNQWALFVCAYQFLTRLPAPANFEYSNELMHEAARYYALVGALVGLFGALVFVAANLLLPVLVSLIFSTIATIYLTGAFHEDGFADMCDGLGGGVTPERALEIMRDSRLGTYGAAGLVLMLALKISLLFALTENGISDVWLIAALVAGHCLSRASAVVVIATSDYVRMEGAAKPVLKGIRAPGKWVVGATCFAVLLLGALCLTPSAMLGGLIALIAAHFFIRRVFENRLNGYTGDCLGATQQVSEVGFYLGVVACM
ncbi:MAG: adenosylcobinamide-GDP ribazoletransferase [Candidatus Azotimanducaceae bacterium]|jgi:adenosylcobinamide-GDP ribazoletransferase